jgi:hypothetical protein
VKGTGLGDQAKCRPFCGLSSTLSFGSGGRSVPANPPAASLPDYLALKVRHGYNLSWEETTWPHQPQR